MSISTKTQTVDIGKVFVDSINLDPTIAALGGVVKSSSAVNTVIDDTDQIYVYNSMSSIYFSASFGGVTFTQYGWAWGVQGTWVTNANAKFNDAWLSTNLGASGLINFSCSNIAATGTTTTAMSSSSAAPTAFSYGTAISNLQADGSSNSENEILVSVVTDAVNSLTIQQCYGLLSD